MSISLIRTLILYLCIVFSLRLMGKRQLGELEPSELVTTILISELAAIPMQDLGVPLFSGIIPVFILVAVEIMLSFISLKSLTLRRIFNGKPTIIIRSGHIDEKKIAQLRITADEILEALRKSNIGSVSEVKYGILEASGQLSYILQTPYRPVTAEMMQLSPKDSGLPLVVISDGKLIHQNMKMLNKSEKDIEQQVRKAHLHSISDVFLMTLDDCSNVFIQPKEDKK